MCALPRLTVLLTSSFAGWNNDKMMGDPQAMQRFANSVILWDLHTRKPKKGLDVPGAPLEIRSGWDADHDYCFPTTALTSKIFLICRRHFFRLACLLLSTVLATSGAAGDPPHHTAGEAKPALG